MPQQMTVLGGWWGCGLALYWFDPEKRKNSRVNIESYAVRRGLSWALGCSILLWCRSWRSAPSWTGRPVCRGWPVYSASASRLSPSCWIPLRTCRWSEWPSPDLNKERTWLINQEEKMSVPLWIYWFDTFAVLIEQINLLYNQKDTVSSLSTTFSSFHSRQLKQTDSSVVRWRSHTMNFIPFCSRQPHTTAVQHLSFYRTRYRTHLAPGVSISTLRWCKQHSNLEYFVYRQRPFRLTHYLCILRKS